MNFTKPTQNAGHVFAPRTIVDLVVYVYIFLLGAFQFTHYLRTADFVTDVTYPDLARSLIERGSYQIGGLLQTTLPPGLPFILAPIGRLLGFTPAVLFPVIAVCTALGLITAYRFLRSVEGQGVAAVACLLLGSSPSLFGFNTAVVFPEMPYLFASMLALLLAVKIDGSDRENTPIRWIVLLSIVVALAVLIRSVGVALLVGLVAWILVSLVKFPETGKLRMRRFLIPLAVGLAAQIGWGVWAHHHQILEWQLPGYPQSYLSQLKVKNGQDPELGFAHLNDIPIRIGNNLLTRAAGFDEMLTRRYVSKFWSSPAIGGVGILIVIGLLSSLRNGGQLHDWYFLFYECIYVVWPWDYRDRFVYPVAPLACLYLWRGLKAVTSYSIRVPRVAAVCAIVCGCLLSLSSAAFAFHIAAFATDSGHARGDRLQPIVATLLWGGLALVGLVTILYQLSTSARGGTHWFARLSSIDVSRVRLLSRVAVILAVAVLVFSGTKQILSVGRNNRAPDITAQSLYPELEVSQWIREHEALDRVLMAREPEFIFHYTQRQVVWFPPISDPKVLMDGIQRHHVDVMVVLHHSNSYWIPSEDSCMRSLLQAYPTSFTLSKRGADYWVYAVVPP